MFPVYAGILLACWAVAFSWRFTLATGHKLRDIADHVLMVGNLVALFWFFGLAALLDWVKG